MTYAMLTAFLIGMAHALEADHLAAVASFSVRGKSVREIVRRGVSWGIGHSITLFVLVVPLFLLGGAISPRLESGMESLVGVMLIALGLRLIWVLRRDRVHVHVHSHDDGERHVHVHSHKDDPVPHAASPHDHSHAPAFSRRSLGVGLLHGAAGSAALLLLVDAQVPVPWQVIPFVLLFGLGSVAGMAFVSMVFALPLRWAARSAQRVLTGIQYAASAAAITVGGMLLHEGLSAVL